ncbi:MAG: galactosyldiacylglycerol synthase [Anaerolineales bacterium]|nr:MAG: galactosyldiacylglycerol synthase [Anaerolineales bacterium]
MESQKARVLFLFSDTGGGHRSAAEAIIEALELRYAETIEPRMVDVFKEYAPRPLDRLPDLYPEMARHPQMWGWGYKLSDGPQAAFLEYAFWPYVRRATRRLVHEQEAECIVSVHPLFNSAYLRAAGKDHPPFITVVTDLVTAHTLWYEPKADLCIVPTEKAAQRALENGIGEEKVRVIGLPVARNFCVPFGDERSLREELKWPLDRPVILLVGGGEGMGPLEETAEKISSLDFDLALAIVTGRNEALKQKLERRSWPVPTFVYGFEHRIPDMMRAATLLVTKAGPGTITEALNAGLPMVLYSHLPGQETGNIDYVVEAGVGLWAPGPQRAAEAVRWWLWNEAVLKAAGEACQRMARPQAAMEIAEIISEWALRSKENPSPANTI